MAQPFEETISFLLVQVCRAHRNKANDLLSTIDLHAGQEFVMRHVGQNDGLTQSDLAEHLCVQPATVTKMLDRMVNAGLLERRKDADDQRVSRVYLTDRGWAIQRSIEEVWQELEACSMAKFTTDEKVLFRRLLMQMRDNLTK